MKKIVCLTLFASSLRAMNRPPNPTIKDQVPSLRTLCLNYILVHNVPRGASSNCLVEQAQIQENVCDFYISRGLTFNSVTLLKNLLEKDILIPENYRILPSLFQQWRTSPIRKWKAACVMEPFTSLLKLIADKKLATKKEFFEALELVIKEQADSFALAEFLIQVPIENNLSNYSCGNIVLFPTCNNAPNLELKQFLKILIGAHISIELKNSMLRRSAHQKITHGQIEYEPIIGWLLENGADKTILSSYEQNNLGCAIQN